MTTLREIYTPKSGETDAENLRYIFSEEFNINTVQVYDPTQIHKTIEINDINTCQYDKDDIIKPKDIESNPLTLQQQNTFNDLYTYVHMLQENSFLILNKKTKPKQKIFSKMMKNIIIRKFLQFIFLKIFFNSDDKNKIIYIERKPTGKKGEFDYFIRKDNILVKIDENKKQFEGIVETKECVQLQILKKDNDPL